LLHEYYVSITTIQLHQNGAVDLTFKFVAHDLEKAIELETGVAIQVDEQDQLTDSILETYIKNHFEISGLEEANYLGREFNLDETFYVYFTARYDTTLSKFNVRNTLLLQTFEAQENITHINKGTTQKSLSFKRNLTNYTVNINE